MATSFSTKLFETYKDQPVAILCMRYWYRGRLTEVGEDYIVLSNACAVEQTGPAAAAEPTTEDPIPSDVVIKTDVIEIVCQPGWVWKGFQD